MRGMSCHAGLVFTMAGFGHPTEHIPPAFNIFGPQVSFARPELSCGWHILIYTLPPGFDLSHACLLPVTAC